MSNSTDNKKLDLDVPKIREQCGKSLLDTIGIGRNSELVNEILNTKTKKKQERLITQSLDLARLSQGLLKGEELTNFIKRSYEMIK